MTLTAITDTWRARAPVLRSVLRIFLAFIFVQAGTMKLFAFPMGMPPDGAAAHAFSEFWFAGVLETFGGALALVGLFTRPIAFLFAGEMAVAYFQFFARASFWPIVNGGPLPAVCCFLWLYFSAAGAGPWSLDAWRARSRGAVTPAGTPGASRATRYE